jgi:hypothetical protein
MVMRGTVVCPLCNGVLKIHGSYWRHIHDANNEIHEGWVAQGHCEACKIYPSLIPDFIMPYKHYEAAVIEAAISKVEEEGGLRLNESPADDSTIRRWVKEFKERGALAAGRLLSILYAVYERHISALEIQNLSLMKQLARLMREMPAPETGGVIGRVNIILTRYNSGFL